MERTELLDILEVCKPALAEKDFIPVYTHFCFDEKTVTAFNDVIGIQAPCETDIKCAINGLKFLDWLKRSRFRKLKFEEGDDELLVKAGKSKLNLPFLVEEDFLFTMPSPKKYKKGFHVKFDATYLDGLQLCLIGATDDLAVGDKAGVRLKFDDKVSMFSTDGITISKYLVNDTSDLKAPKKLEEVPMPFDFCHQVRKLSKLFKVDALDVYIHETYVIADLGNGYLIYGKLPIITSDEDLDGIVNKYLDSMKDAEFIEMPKAISNALNRALVYLTDLDIGTTCTIEDERINLYTKSKYGVADDTLRLKSFHDDVKVGIYPKNFLRVLDYITGMYILPKCTIFTDERGFVHIVSNINVI